MNQLQRLQKNHRLRWVQHKIDEMADEINLFEDSGGSAGPRDLLDREKTSSYQRRFQQFRFEEAAIKRELRQERWGTILFWVCWVATMAAISVIPHFIR